MAAENIEKHGLPDEVKQNCDASGQEIPQTIGELAVYLLKRADVRKLSWIQDRQLVLAFEAIALEESGSSSKVKMLEELFQRVSSNYYPEFSATIDEFFRDIPIGRISDLEVSEKDLLPSKKQFIDVRTPPVLPEVETTQRDNEAGGDVFSSVTLLNRDVLGKEQDIETDVLISGKSKFVDRSFEGDELGKKLLILMEKYPAVKKLFENTNYWLVNKGELVTVRKNILSLLDRKGVGGDQNSRDDLNRKTSFFLTILVEKYHKLYDSKPGFRFLGSRIVFYTQEEVVRIFSIVDDLSGYKYHITSKNGFNGVEPKPKKKL